MILYTAISQASSLFMCSRLYKEQIVYSLIKMIHKMNGVQ